ncbi:hypothetical protein KGM_200136 [Danaus plexippus plexippus]|uniref:Uncharacterized protein n=1 Tax=Danaus plexippus plexippus TaxID=278856 RepID=A0A212FBY9_DANPL|nr:hypothetical protein KGM_200136 [Danaus plexippus plexippus]
MEEGFTNDVANSALVPVSHTTVITRSPWANRATIKTTHGKENRNRSLGSISSLFDKRTHSQFNALN